MSTREALTRFWPTFGLRLTTPRLELRPVTDDDLADLITLAQDGVHDPSFMPFVQPWTDAPPEELPGNTLRFFWNTRGAESPDNWRLQFAVRRNGEFLGVQELQAANIAVRRTVETGSWLGRRFHGRGIGTEMRSAVIAFAFDELGARRAETSAFAGNTASLRVTEKLGYRANGDRVLEQRGKAGTELRFVVTPETFRRPDWSLKVDGLEPCRERLGLRPDPESRPGHRGPPETSKPPGP